jgi:hypothetical protein
MAFAGFLDANWIRDSYTARYEKRVKPSAVGSDLTTYERRLIRRLVRHKACDTLSTDYVTWASEGLEGATTTNPLVWVGTSQTEQWGTDIGWFEYAGTWEIEEVDIQDSHDGKSIVRQALVLEGAWEAVT